jgi:hypothetical protein
MIGGFYEMRKEIEKLIPLLNEAAKCFYELGHVDIWDTNYYADELGIFCKEVSDKILNGTISLKEKAKLWGIFAPTCAWDDSVGNVELGNEIFDLLEKLYRNEILTEFKGDRRK